MPVASDRFFFEKQLYEQGARTIAGIDEAGRGPLAGPVVAAAVILPRDFAHQVLNDSKQLTASAREEIWRELANRDDVRWAVGIKSNEEIDQLNIAGATYRAMESAVLSLPEKPDFLMVDGRPVPVFGTMRQLALIKGDSKSFSIAAASVIAKVTRDRLMLQYHESFPEYGFDRHKGYGTRDHLEALERHGPCPIHRKTFFPIRKRDEPQKLLI